jgi:hypothetical protein
MKALLSANVIAILLLASIGFAGEWPPTSPVRGTEGPEVRATDRVPFTPSVPRVGGGRSR